MKNNKKFLAFDIGGTKTSSAIVEFSSTGYKIIGYKKTETQKNEKDFLEKILSDIEIYSKKYGFGEVRISIAGQVDKSGKIVSHSPNLSINDNYPLVEKIKKQTGFKVVLKNDVQCFALGENYFGKYGNYQNAIFVAIGTGIGGAIKINGKFYYGANNMAGEFGHMTIAYNGTECSCGRSGCFERYASGKGIENLYKDAFNEDKSAKDILLDAYSGSVKDLQIVSEASYFFSVGISNLINILDPEIVILGGSIVKNKEFLNLAMPLIRKQVLPPAKKVMIKKSSLGDKAYLLGASL